MNPQEQPTPPLQTTTETTEPTPLLPAQTAPKSKKKLIIAVVAGVVVALAAAVGVYAFITNSPNYLLNAAAENLGRKDAIAATFTTDAEGDGKADFTGDLALQGAQNKKDAQFVLGLGSGSTRIAISALIIEEALYFKADGLQNFGPLAEATSPGSGASFSDPEVAKALARVNNKWFFMTKEELAATANSAGEDSVSGAPTPEELQKVVDIYKKHQFIISDKSYADEKVADTNCAHFSIKPDREKFVAFLQDLKAANLQNIKVTDNDIEEAKKIEDLNKDFLVEVWITRDTKEFKQFRTTGTSEQKGVLTVTFLTNLPQLDPITKPADAKPVAEFMSTLLGPQFTTGIEEL